MNISYFISAEVLFPLLQETGYGIELTRFINKEILENYKQYMEETKVDMEGISSCVLHGPFTNLSTCTKDSHIIDDTKKYYELIYEVAQELGAVAIVFHTGYDPNNYDYKQALEQSTLFWQEYLSDKENMTFYLENVMEQDYTFLMTLYQRIQRPNVKLCLDVGHANKNSSSVERWITHLGGAIGYVHLHNNDGIYDQHRAIGDGTLDMERTLQMLLTYAPEATWSLETEGVAESLEWLRKRGYIE